MDGWKGSRGGGRMPGNVEEIALLRAELGGDFGNICITDTEGGFIAHNYNMNRQCRSIGESSEPSNMRYYEGSFGIGL